MLLGILVIDRRDRQTDRRTDNVPLYGLTTRRKQRQLAYNIIVIASRQSLSIVRTLDVKPLGKTFKNVIKTFNMSLSTAATRLTAGVGLQRV